MASCNDCIHGVAHVGRKPCPDGCVNGEMFIETDESKLRRFAEIEARLAACEDLLIAIGDYADNNSTGPAAPDALWEVRRMAYEQ